MEKRRERKKILDFLEKFLVLVVILCLVVVITLMLRGKTTTSGQHPEDVKDDTLSCFATGKEYPFFRIKSGRGSETKIEAIFHLGELKTISLQQTLFYDSVDEIIASEAHNHAAMNIKFGELGLKADAFTARYARYDDKMIMTLFSKGEEFDEVAEKFFFADFENGGKDKTRDGFERNFENQGFVCTTNQ